MTAIRRLKRFPDWEARLRDHIDQARGQDFVRGMRDCALWACDGILAMTGVDIAAAYRGQYGTLTEARAALKRIAGGTLYDAVVGQIGAPMDNPAFARRGDLVMFNGPEGATMCLVDLTGTHLAGFDADGGLLFHHISRAEKAWHIGG